MHQIVNTFLNYHPFDWIHLIKAKDDDTVNDFLETVFWVELIVFILCFIGLFIHTFVKTQVRISLVHKIISFSMSMLAILIFWYLCFFGINSIVIIFLTFLGSVTFFVVNVYDTWRYWGGWIFSSFVEYFMAVEARKEKLKKYQKNYNDLLNFKI